MAKKLIIQTASGERIPFLRGVLVESLARSGLSFRDAYLVAQSVRDGLGDGAEIGADALKEQAASEVRKRFGETLATAYERGSALERQVTVRYAADEAPFSAGLLSRSLEACAIRREDALETAKQVHDHLRKAGEAVIDHLSLRQVVHEHLQQQCSHSAADRYLCWQQFRDSGLPLILLIGGITGTGKSTLTTELAYRLNIVRTQSTDMMREIVRSYLPRKKVPTLAYSSFEAWRGLPKRGAPAKDVENDALILGFLSQFSAVKRGLEATIYRAVKEAQDLIVDGVHVLPSRLELDIATDQAIVIPLMLVVPKRKTLAKRLKHRAREQPERPASRYIQGLDEIWALQSYLVTEAERHDVPLIVNSDIDEALHELLMQISDTIAGRFPSSPKISPGERP